MDRYLNANEVMERLGIGRTTAYALFSTEGFPGVKFGKTLRVSEVELEKWLDNHRVTACNEQITTRGAVDLNTEKAHGTGCVISIDAMELAKKLGKKCKKGKCARCGAQEYCNTVPAKMTHEIIQKALDWANK